MADAWLASALERPSDFSRATVELSMDFPMWLMPAKAGLERFHDVNR